MYEIEFYENSKGESQILIFLEKLRVKSHKSKEARIQYKQLLIYINLLSQNGTYLSSKITKHIDENIWELRPGVNRIFYFIVDEKKYVLLHQFRKNTKKRN